jgi:pimeloyl-ACP methyl ester carboxylesterase
MSRTLGPLAAEFSQPESAKFTAPLVLVHGLWDDLHSWRRFSGFLSHRGWRCVAVGWPNGDASASLGGRERDLRLALDELGDLAIVIGHDIGGLIALRCADRARAAIAMAPLVPGAPSAALAGAGTWAQRLRGAARSPVRAHAEAYPRGGRRTESIGLLSEITAAAAADGLPAASERRLVVAGADDPVTPPAAARSLAGIVGAEFEVAGGLHALHLDDGWETVAGLVHRWIIKSLGEDLLAFYEEAWADREP